MLPQFHLDRGARPANVNGTLLVADYGDAAAERGALAETVAVLDLSARSRLCLLGADRARYLHGQVTQDVNRLRPGQGAYAVLATAKGKIESDLHIYCLADELLLDFEPGLSAKIIARLEKYLVADDVQIVDAAPHYGLLSLQGPRAEETLRALQLTTTAPAKPGDILAFAHPEYGELYLAHQPRLRTVGFDLFVPCPALPALFEKLASEAHKLGGRPAGWIALEAARIAAGIPRYGADMDDTTFPQECGIEPQTVVYNKGCYLGQEIINRIHTQGRVNRRLCSLRLPLTARSTVKPGDKLFLAGREVGHITSLAPLPVTGQPALPALGYLHRDVLAAQPGGASLQVQSAAGPVPVEFTFPAES